MGTRRILIADDSPIETEHIRKSLEGMRGTEVVCVEDGATALSECKRARYDLVLCDFEMPGLNGLQVVRLLRSSWSRLELPVLMLTVRDDVQTKVLSLRQGANDYVTKPVEPEELLARVQGQLDLKSAVEANIEARVRMLEERKLATIGRLAAGLAHDLNTPAQFTADNLVFLQKAVAGSAQLLERTRDYLVSRPAADAGVAH
jgi:DNA-binding response OmpR family regulator